MLARYGAPGVDRRPQDLAFEGFPLLLVGLEHGEVHVAVADVPAARDEGAVLACQLGHPCQVVGDGGAGDDGIDDVVGPRGLRHEEQSLPGHDEVRAGVRRQDVDVDGIEGFEQCAQLLDILLEPDGRRLLEHDDEIGLRRILDGVGNAEVESGRLGDAAQDERVGVFEDGGIDARGHDPGHGVRHVGQGPERDQDGGGVRRPWLHLHRHLGCHGQGALRTDEQLRQVVAGGALDEFAPGAQHGPVGQHRLEAQHVVAGHAVADGAHSTGIGPDVPTQRCCLLAR